MVAWARGFKLDCDPFMVYEIGLVNIHQHLKTKQKGIEWKIREHHISKGKYCCYVTFLTVICTALQ